MPIKTTPNVITLGQFKEKHYGKPGTAKRKKLEAGYIDFKAAAVKEMGKLR